MTQRFHNDSIYWVELEKIQPNPYQPRREFNPVKLQDLADSIRQYGVLQPLVVTRKEYQTDDGGLSVNYELIAGERRLRASYLAGINQVPVIIKTMEDDGRVKLEIAIIENIQREDLNPMDRAFAFSRLVNEFNFKHIEVAQKVGKSREYVSNTIRLLSLPEEIQKAVSEGGITEGHARPLMMLVGKPEEQTTLFKEIVIKKLTVREAEAISRRIAVDRIRKHSRNFDPEIIELENKLTETLGARVQIEKKEIGGKVIIDFLSDENLRGIFDILNKKDVENPVVLQTPESKEEIIDDRSKEEKETIDTDEDLYSIKNFSI